MSKKIFVTGATGFIGGLLANKLVELGHQVTVLVRDPARAHRLRHPRIELVRGDLDSQSLMESAMAGAEVVFHLAALAGVWAPGDTFQQVNVMGTEQVLQAALSAAVPKVIITSTAGVMGPASGGPVDEETVRKTDFFSEYERTKYLAEQLVPAYMAQGLHIVVVNPTRVYGPGPLHVSNAVTQLIRKYTEGRWRFLPGDGKRVGNYVFVDDVVAGHLLAWERGRSGQRYLLGGEDVSYEELFATVARHSGRTHRLWPLPLGLMLAFGYLQGFLAENFGRQPLITPGWVRKYHYDWRVSSAKAQRELNYTITPLEEGVRRTLAWLGENKSH
jgi:nucleoside-diphosphate-sugar epimerase